MKARGITARFKESLNLGDYRSLSVELSLFGDIGEDETEDDAVDSVMTFLREKVGVELRKGSCVASKTVETVVTPKFAGKPVQ